VTAPVWTAPPTPGAARLATMLNPQVVECGKIKIDAAEMQ
jgi:hypothetical protein